MLDALIIGGTGLISTGIVKHLLARGARVTTFNRGRRERTLPDDVRQIAGDRADSGAFVAAFGERRFRQAADSGAFELTIARPSHTYGPGGSLIDQQEFDSGTWDRVARGLPVLIAGDGLGLWQY